jgi:hypothetical protein
VWTVQYALIVSKVPFNRALSNSLHKWPRKKLQRHRSFVYSSLLLLLPSCTQEKRQPTGVLTFVPTNNREKGHNQAIPMLIESKRHVCCSWSAFPEIQCSLGLNKQRKNASFPGLAFATSSPYNPMLIDDYHSRILRSLLQSQVPEPSLFLHLFHDLHLLSLPTSITNYNQELTPSFLPGPALAPLHQTALHNQLL